ncbi:hypothetical protein L6R52_20675 [Myxococcota bacterium]|nr:hypothetical protein [Myxococcota bacterium]
MKRLLKIAAALVAVVVVALVAVVLVASRSVPEGRVGGAPADALARSIERAIDLDAWKRTGAVTWVFGARNTHLWDRTRNVARVRFGEHEVFVNLSTRTGIAKKSGAVVAGAEGEALVAKAYAAWVNDAFWLNPLAKLFDDGVTREKIDAPDGIAGETGLLVTYGAGGLTPGDRYLWILPAGSALPDRWRMWVSVLPIRGLAVTWDGWVTLSTGAKVSTRHVLGPVTLEVTDVKGAATLAELTGSADDPFAPLFR